VQILLTVAANAIKSQLAAGRKCRSIAARGAWQQQQQRRRGANAASATLTAGIYAVNK